MQSHAAQIVEVFSSLQGEGIYAGEPMTFVRFASCNMRCRFCDTPQGLCDSPHCRVETPPRSSSFSAIDNPVSATRLCEILQTFEDPWISVTGGEPLEQAGFLAEWLPAMAPSRRVMLETNGVLHAELAKVLPHVHVVSMDIKLPSSTGCAARWADHAAFLSAAVASGREIYVKLVVTAETTDRDLQDAIGLVTKVNKYIPIVIQPATPTLTFNSPVSDDRLHAVGRLVGAYLEDVRIVPQMHKEWNVL
ncbi:MAG: 7-carboxy-7-deazaguanine synthase QueE [bacterium]